MLDLINISLQFNGKYLFKDVSVKIHSDDKLALVGSNGAGKSSLLKLIIGELEPESGKILRRNKLSIGYLPQDNITHKGRTVLEEASSALEDIIELQNKEEELTEQLANDKLTAEERDDLVYRLGTVHHHLEGLDSYSATARVEKVLTGLGFTHSDMERLTDEFSGGWQMRLALAKILIARPELILLDEPTNHLDIDSLQWLIGYLKNYDGALIIISHDRHFISQVTSKTLEIYFTRVYFFKGNYEAFLRYKEERDLQLEHQQLIQQKKIKETERFIERFRYKATKAKQVQSRIRQLEKMELIQLEDKESQINIKFPQAPPCGNIVLELKGISKSYGTKKVFENLDMIITKGEKIAFLGPNGAGKSTLSKIISGKLEPSSGSLKVGHGVVMAFYAQDVADTLNPELDILETLEEISEEKTIAELRSLAGAFLFSGDDVFKKVGVLSGGEKGRVALLRILLQKANLLILDEPTNHLDFASKEILRRALELYEGTVILVSHDIEFLEPVVERIFDFRNGSVKEYPGGIRYYLEKREQEQQAGASVPEKSVKQPDTIKISRKDQKRLEAEIRKQKYAQTKGLIIKRERVEQTIDMLEKEKAVIESELANPETYSDPVIAKEITQRYLQVKETLEVEMTRWTELSEEIEMIELKFEQLLKKENT